VTLSPEAGEWLSRQDFFGNVRELRNLVERTAILVNGSVLFPEHFEANANGRKPLTAKSEKTLLPLDEAEKQAILKAIEAYPNNMARVARTLGISRGALYRRLEKYDIAHESKN
jgi:two-component system NtrC family response regulator